MIEKRQGVFSKIDLELFPLSYMEKVRREAHLFGSPVTPPVKKE